MQRSTVHDNLPRRSVLVAPLIGWKFLLDHASTEGANKSKRRAKRKTKLLRADLAALRTDIATFTGELDGFTKDLAPISAMASDFEAGTGSEDLARRLRDSVVQLTSQRDVLSDLGNLLEESVTDLYIRSLAKPKGDLRKRLTKLQQRVAIDGLLDQVTSINDYITAIVDEDLTPLRNLAEYFKLFVGAEDLGDELHGYVAQIEARCVALQTTQQSMELHSTAISDRGF